MIRSSLPSDLDLGARSFATVTDRHIDKAQLQLMPDKFAKRVLAGHTFHLLCMGELLLGEGAKGHPQNFAVEAILAPEVVVDSGLVDPSLGDNGADSGFFLVAWRQKGARRPQGPGVV
jgi:hypothetical protein